ncbi:MAG TPA: DUF3996 domain-containing protein [Kofleriaceae bacterium]|nr:DUF3996 domain-containing protein [Kofleriaceae bacterium]
MTIPPLAALTSACALVAFSSDALAQGRPECKSTETQAECHARLKCKPDEELEACKDRLAAGKKGGGGDDRGGDDRGGDDGGSDRGDRDRGGDDGGSDRGDRWDRDRGGDDGGSDRGDGRWDRDRDSGGGGSDRGGRWRDRDDGGGGGGGGGFQASKTFGLGLELGEPTGLNGKYFLSETGALDFGVGWIYRHYYYDDGLHIYLDYLWHPTSLASSASLEVPLYIGLGLRFWDFEYCDPEPGPDFCYDGTAIGIRIPIGFALDFNTAPVDIFLQVVPVIDFLSDDYYDRYDDRTHVGIDASIGIRYWFN